MEKTRKKQCLRNNDVKCSREWVIVYTNYWHMKMYTSKHKDYTLIPTLISLGSYFRNPSIDPGELVTVCTLVNGNEISYDTVVHFNGASHTDCEYSSFVQTAEYCARNYRPSFHENKPKTLVLYD
jgi:hypothetical protein